MEPRITITPRLPRAGKAGGVWTQALGYSSPGGFGEFWPLVPTNDSEPLLVLQKVSEPPAGKNRMHLDLHVADWESEVARLQGLGASRLSDEVIEGFGHQWVVMTDPEGNEFNIVRRPTSA